LHKRGKIKILMSLTLEKYFMSTDGMVELRNLSRFPASSMVGVGSGAASRIGRSLVHRPRGRSSGAEARGEELATGCCFCRAMKVGISRIGLTRGQK